MTEISCQTSHVYPICATDKIPRLLIPRLCDGVNHLLKASVCNIIVRVYVLFRDVEDLTFFNIYPEK